VSFFWRSSSNSFPTFLSTDGTFVRESSVSPASLVSPPPSPLLDRRAGTPEPGIVTTQHTKVVYKRHSNLTKRQETAAEYAVVYVTMVLLSLFAESAGVARPLLHLAWFSWAVAQVIYASGWLRDFVQI
jgi:hypothetical protein